MFSRTIRSCSVRLPALLVAISIFSTGCNRVHHAKEIAYVSATQAVLRDQVSAVYNKTGTVTNGERVEVLDRDRRFAHVRTASGAEGWIEQRYLVTRRVYDTFQKLAQQEQNDPIQATAVTRNETNMHIEPGRETEHLYQLAQGTKISLLKRATAEKILPGEEMQPAPAGAEAPKPVLEDWWLGRDDQGHTGWVLARMMDVDIPLDVAQYAEGQRIIADFVLDHVSDGGKQVPDYLVLLSEPTDGLPYDFDQLRVFTWNVKRHRYETAYREHDLQGFLPVMLSQETFDKEGTLPVFTIHVKDKNGNMVQEKYKFDSPIVRRVYAPGEAPTPTPARKQHRKG